MSKDSLPFNPYLPPAEVLAEPVHRGRSGMLITVCVLAMALGSIGLLTGSAQAIGLFAGKQIQQALQPPRQPGQNDELARIQQDMQDQMDVIAQQYFVPNTILVLVHFSVASLLLLGGALAFALWPAGRKILIAVCVLAICYEVGRSAVQVVVMLKTMPVMESFMEQTISATPMPQGSNRQAQEVVHGSIKAGMKIGQVLGFAFAGFFVIAKLAYYITALSYMSRANVKALFDANAGSGHPAPGRV